MNRRSFLKQVAATAAVGAVAPKVLAETATMGADTAMAGTSRVVVGGTQYEIGLDIAMAMGRIASLRRKVHCQNRATHINLHAP